MCNGDREKGERELAGLLNSGDVRIFGWFDSWGNYSDAAAGLNQL